MYNNKSLAIGIPYDDINWYDIEGQPFGRAQNFNAIVFNDANNIIDISGAFAVGGNFYSPRGLSLAFGTRSKLLDTGYNPYDVRFLSGGSVTTSGPLVVVGHVVGDGPFYLAKGSTYLIGKSNNPDQLEELKYLYQRAGGSRYWTPTDKGDHYIVPSYDVPRYIPASRVRADVPSFFRDARASINAYKECIENLEVNGTVINNNHEYILRGSDPLQNVFLIDVRPNGLITKGIRAEVPNGSLVIVKLRTGDHAHLQYGVYGEESRANHTLYVFEDATQIHMEKPSDIWGSILAPQAMFHGHPTGGHVSGNVALGSFAVNPNSGFEFHLYPFVGGVACQGLLPGEEIPEVPVPETPTPEVPVPETPVPPVLECPPCPTCPEVIPCPAPQPCPTPEPCPTPPPCPTCPTPEPCPIPEPCPTCPTPPPCPIPEPCPTPQPCPTPPPCPICPLPEPCPVCPACPTPEPCPTCPTCPTPQPCPTCPTCPTPEPCPTCPTCPACPVCPIPEPCPTCPPCPTPQPCPICPPCPEYAECDIMPGLIEGCIWDCQCCEKHEWKVSLCQCIDGDEYLLYSLKVACCECFVFEVPFDGNYLLSICTTKQVWNSKCKPALLFKNVGVDSLMIEYH